MPVLYAPFGPDRNCGDFSTWAQAQDFYEAAGGNNAHGLDSNKDGVAPDGRRGGGHSRGSKSVATYPGLWAAGRRRLQCLDRGRFFPFDKPLVSATAWTGSRLCPGRRTLGRFGFCSAHRRFNCRLVRAMRFADRSMGDFGARTDLQEFPTFCLAPADTMNTLKGAYGHLPAKLVTAPCWARELLPN